MENVVVHHLFEKQVEKNPGKIAIREEEKEISYLSLNEQANDIARLLYAIGAGKDTVIAYLGNSGINLVSSLLGIFKAGGIYLPVDASFPASRICSMLDETNCTIGIISKNDGLSFTNGTQAWKASLQYLLVLDGNGQLEDAFLKQVNGEWVHVELPFTNVRGNPNYEITEEFSNYIFYTSGSTGTGKPFLGWHKGLSHFIDWETREFNLDESIRVSQLTRITFDASLRDIFLPLTNGGTLYIPSENTKSNVVRIQEWLEENSISIMHIVPSVFRLLNKELKQTGNKNGRRFPALKHILMAGEPLYAKDINSWRENVGEQVELVNLYGTSETTMAKTFHRIKEVSSDPGQMIHAGKPIDGAFIAIINNGQLCSIGEIGEIYIKTPYRTKGYYKNETLTNKFFVQNPLQDKETDIVHKTGDMGRYLADRSIEVLGRSDDQVKVNGIRLQLSDVEQCMLSCDGVEEAVVLVHKNRDQDNELVGYYTGEKVNKEILREYLVAQIGQTIVPGYLVQLDEFPLSTNGKVNKKELPRPDELIISNEDYEPVWPGVETDIERIWKELLGLERIGRKLSFFEIGGNSLKAIQLISKIYKKYHVLVKINEIFTYSSIEQLTAHIQQSLEPVAAEIPSLPEKQGYELSHGQKRFWAINQAETNKSSYNVPAAFEITGTLDIQILSQAIGRLVERHEILRTRFTTIDGEPVQQIIPFKEGRFVEYVDLRNNAGKENIVKDWISKVSYTEFDLEKGNLIRVVVLQTGNENYTYLFTMHHIICDGWSIEVLNKEMLILYNAILKNEEARLPALRIQYKEFAAWQNREKQTPAFENHRQYWLQHLGGPLPRINLPLDYPRPAEKKYDGKTISFFIGKEEKNKLQETAKQNDASLFMVSLALLNTLLYNHTKQEDFLIGSPVAGREHPDLENQVGLYINTVLLRNQVKPDQGFDKLLQRVKENSVKALTHQSYPFDLLVDELEFEQTRGRNLLFDVGFTYFNEDIFQSGSEKAGQQFTVKELDHQFHDVKADIWFKIVEAADRLIVTITYSTLLFRPSFIDQLTEDFRLLVSLVTADTTVSMETIEKAVQHHHEQQERNKRIALKKHITGKLKALQLQK
jgi:amino acid adenylation domain-containing protein